MYIFVIINFCGWKNKINYIQLHYWWHKNLHGNFRVGKFILITYLKPDKNLQKLTLCGVVSYVNFSVKISQPEPHWREVIHANEWYLDMILYYRSLIVCTIWSKLFWIRYFKTFNRCCSKSTSIRFWPFLIFLPPRP